jgi:hypothetical protein
MAATTDILTLIDSTLFTLRDMVEHSTDDGLCACGCRRPVDSTSASGWWAGVDCMQIWQATKDDPSSRQTMFMDIQWKRSVSGPKRFVPGRGPKMFVPSGERWDEFIMMNPYRAYLRQNADSVEYLAAVPGRNPVAYLHLWTPTVYGSVSDRLIDELAEHLEVSNDGFRSMRIDGRWHSASIVA